MQRSHRMFQTALPSLHAYSRNRGLRPDLVLGSCPSCRPTFCLECWSHILEELDRISPTSFCGFSRLPFLCQYLWFLAWVGSVNLLRCILLPLYSLTYLLYLFWRFCRNLWPSDRGVTSWEFRFPKDLTWGTSSREDLAPQNWMDLLSVFYRGL